MVPLNETAVPVKMRVVFPAAREVRLEAFEPDPLGPDMVAVRTVATLVSTGTELTILDRRYESGSHWDDAVAFPFYPGYAAVGVVVDVGRDVTDLAPGDRVTVRGPHASTLVVPAIQCARVPDGVDTADAPWFALAKIALMGARAAAYRLGDTVLVIGAGPIGQMSVRWANAAGAREIVVVDAVESRLDLARRGGATHTIAAPIAEGQEAIQAAVGADGPDVVVDSTGNAAVLPEALRVVRRGGRVVLLGDTGSPTSQHLTSDVIIRHVTIVGAHDGDSVPVDRSRWDGDRGLHALFFRLVVTGRFDLGGLNTDVFAPSACEAAYDLARARRGETMGIVFDWNER